MAWTKTPIYLRDIEPDSAVFQDVQQDLSVNEDLRIAHASGEDIVVGYTCEPHTDNGE